MKKYSNDFYQERHKRTLVPAKIILEIVRGKLPAIKSAVDFGCGVGTWLSVLKGDGVNNIKGMEGAWVKEEFLQIKKEDFCIANLENKIKLDFKYDLAISLEVAEHLSAKVSSQFVESLTSASDFVLFSAGIPFQEGTNHINLQWQEYWAKLFMKKNYLPFDFIRKEIWKDKRVPVYYRQNILMYIKKNRISEVKNVIPIDSPFVSVVHPEFYLSKTEKIEKMYTIKGSFKLLRKAIKKNLFTSK